MGAGPLGVISALPAVAIVAVHIALVFGAFLSLVYERHLIAIEVEIEAGRVSVIVPARDAQARLPRLLSCLERQNTNRFEIVLVNDRSEDRTSDIMHDFSARHHHRVRVVTLVDDPSPVEPQQRALSAGVAAATGDVLLITSPDAWLPVDWVRTMCRPFKSHDAGLVFGPLMPHGTGEKEHNGYLAAFQGFDQLLRYQYTAALAGLGIPLGSFGINLAIRRQALAEIGGFDELYSSYTVGVPLTGHVRRTGNWAVRAIRSRGARIVPMPEAGLRSAIAKRIRWSTGGLVARDSTTRRLYACVVAAMIISVALVPVAFSIGWSLVLPAAGILAGMFLMAVTAGYLVAPEGSYWILLLPNLVLFMIFETVVMLLSILRRVWQRLTR